MPPLEEADGNSSSRQGSAPRVRQRGRQASRALEQPPGRPWRQEAPTGPRETLSGAHWAGGARKGDPGAGDGDVPLVGGTTDQPASTVSEWRPDVGPHSRPGGRSGCLPMGR